MSEFSPGAGPTIGIRARCEEARCEEKLCGAAGHRVARSGDGGSRRLRRYASGAHDEVAHGGLSLDGVAGGHAVWRQVGDLQQAAART